MRHIDLYPLLIQIFADEEGQKAKTRLERARRKLETMDATDRQTHTRSNGPNKWKPIKERLTTLLGRKCWYTEVEIVGAPLAVDHYRPVCHYWWLAFEAENYRIACPWANSPVHNTRHGCAGGKGDSFPLFPPAVRAMKSDQLPNERPIILDPCNPKDCDLLAFQSDGRPVLNPVFLGDTDAELRVEQSMILLNLDHPEFNSKREQLCIDIEQDVINYEAFPEHSPRRDVIRASLAAKIAANAPFSTAARFYLKFHRHLDWVEKILNPP